MAGELISDEGARLIGDKLAAVIKDALAKGMGAAGKVAESKGVDLKQLADNAIPAATALGGVANAGTAATTTLKMVAGAIPGIGPQATQLVQALEDARLQTNKNARQGIGGLSMFDTAEKAAKAGFDSQEQYRQMVLKSGNALGGLNNTANASSNDLLKVAEAVRNRDLADASGKGSLIKSQAMLGDELGRVTMISQYGRKESLNGAEAQARAAQASEKLAHEIVRQTAITGKSSDVIEAELEERLKQPEVMASMRQMTEKQRESFIQNQAALTGMGTTVQGLSATLGVNGRMTQDQQYALAAMGPAAGEFQRASRMAAMAQTEDQKKQAEAAMAKAKADVNAYQSSAQFARVMNSATGPMADAYKKSYAENQLRDRQAAGQRDTGLSGTSAIKVAETEVDRTVRGKKLDASGKEVDDTAQATSRKMGDISVAATNNTIGMIGALKNLDTQMTKGTGITRLLDEATVKLYGDFKDTTAAEKEHSKTLQNIVNILAPAGGGGAGGGGAGGGNTPNMNPTGRERRQQERTEGRAGGSKDATGDWFESFGSGKMMELHGQEAVVPQNKIGEFMKDMMANMSKAKQPAPQIDLPNVPSSAENPTTGAGSGDNVTLKDVLASLNQLNKTMGQVASHSESISDASNKTARLSSKATGNRMAV
jgi:hypothetical protein